MTEEQYGEIVDSYYGIIGDKFVRGIIDSDTFAVYSTKLQEWMREYLRKKEATE